MEKYNILKASTDFEFIVPHMNTKGSRVKRIALDRKTKEKAYFKYESYNCTEACSEKMCYEIAKVLDYPCAHIELAMDEKGEIGILNYLFVDVSKEEHDDAVSYINKDSIERKYFYTVENIKKCLDDIDKKLFNDFLKIMVFDALVGETDRHEENWGITKSQLGYRISPLYDNGCNLLRNFKDENLAEKYYSGAKDFQSYIIGSKTYIYKNDNKTHYNLIELIEYLYKKYPNQIEKEIKNLDKLSHEKIETIVNKLPNILLTDKHKKHIIIFLKERKKLLKNILEKK